jgi:hypothetical protein
MVQQEKYNHDGIFSVAYQTEVRNNVCIQPCATMPISYGYPSVDVNSSSIARVKLYFKGNIEVSKN